VSKKKLTYEDQALIIDEELKKRRGKWFLNSLAWIDFDDVSQIIRAHIFKKWDQWDQERPLKPWLNRLISNQLKNILRNYYSNFVRPCLSCPFNQSSHMEDGKDALCGFTSTGLQDSTCPLYSKWEKTKKAAYDIKMPFSLDSRPADMPIADNTAPYQIEHAEDKLHAEMKKVLNERQFSLYQLLFIENTSDAEVAKKMGYKTTEKGRKAGYKQIKNLKKQFKTKAISILKNKDIFGNG
tara:strand:- start:1165 stop:1881 length:717 start_codon:yes stop_codon:yes gene_type:complete